MAPEAGGPRWWLALGCALPLAAAAQASGPATGGGRSAAPVAAASSGPAAASAPAAAASAVAAAHAEHQAQRARCMGLAVAAVRAECLRQADRDLATRLQQAQRLFKP